VHYLTSIHTTNSWRWPESGTCPAAWEHAEKLPRRGGGALELEQEPHALVARAVPMLERSLPFRPQALLRMPEMRTGLDRTFAEELLVTSRTHASQK